MLDLLAKYPNGIDGFSEVNTTQEHDRLPQGGMTQKLTASSEQLDNNREAGAFNPAAFHSPVLAS